MRATCSDRLSFSHYVFISGTVCNAMPLGCYSLAPAFVLFDDVSSIN